MTPPSSVYTENNIVSIVIPVFNRAEFIIETLDSIYNQTYSLLELIISDDGSTDNTIDTCRKWINTHNERFVRIILLSVINNTGISANHKRGEKQAQGRWVKTVDSDDILLPNAITEYVSYITDNPNITYLFGKIEAFGHNSDEVINLEQNILQYQFFELSAKEQYVRLMNNACYIPAPSFFYDRIKNDKLGICLDETIPMIDDWPRWINITRIGKKLYLIDNITVRYRLHETAITKSQGISSFVKSQMLMYIKYQFRYNLLRHPRSSWIKYVMFKQMLTEKKIWFWFEKVGRRFDGIYRKIRHSNVNDWDRMADSLPSK